MCCSVWLSVIIFHAPLFYICFFMFICLHSYHFEALCFHFICILSYCFFYVFIFVYPLCLFAVIMVVVSVSYHIFAPFRFFICALASITNEGLPLMIFRDLNKGWMNECWSRDLPYFSKQRGHVIILVPCKSVFSSGVRQPNKYNICSWHTIC